MKVTSVELAEAIIAHEAVDCFVGKEQPTSQQPKNLVSCTGGIFCGKLGEHWPRTADGAPLIPWLQIVCTEMTRLYGPFYLRKAVCFYLATEFSAAEAVSSQDSSDFVVREYLLEDELAPLERPKVLERHVFHRVKWREESDYPSLSKYHGLFDDSVYAALCAEKTLKYENRSGIKIGGWPTPIQSQQRYPGEFHLQIDMTENFMYGDSGIGYLSKSGGAWHVVFDCC